MFDNYLDKWATFVVRRRWFVIITCIMCAAISIIPMKNLYYDNAREIYFVEGDPKLDTFNSLEERFGDNDQVLIGVPKREGDENVFAHDTLQVIHDLHIFLEDHEAISKVTSLANFQYIISENNSLETVDLIEDISELEDSQETRDSFKDIMGDQRIALGRLVTEDFFNTVVIATILEREDDFVYKNVLINDLETFIQEQGYAEAGYSLEVLGAPKVQELFATTTSEDQAVLNPLMTMVMMVILFAFFRSVAGMMLPWLLVGLTVIMTIGIQGLFSMPFNAVVTALPPILIIICMGDAVHIIYEFNSFRSTGLSPPDSAKQAIKSLWLPCFYTSLTTAIGFMALGATKLFPIRELGYLGAAGSVIAFLLSVTLFPAVLSFVRRFPRQVEVGLTDGFISRITKNIPDIVRSNRSILLACVPIMLIFSVGLLSQIKVDAAWANYFKSGNPIHDTRAYFDNSFNGSEGINVMIDSGSESGAKDPTFLKEVAKLQAYLEGLEGTGKANSYVDYVMQMNKSLHDNDPAYYIIPDDRDQVAQFLLLYENSSPEEDLSDLKSFDERYVQLALQVTSRPASELGVLLDEIQGVVDTDFASLSVELTGGLVIQNAQDIYVGESMISSFSLALLLIFACFAFLFRSVKYGLLALIPSIMPILFAGGVLSLMGIPLDLGTMIVGAITLGIAVDDTIHFMSRYLKGFRGGASVHESITSAVEESGRPIILTSIIVTIGFGVLAFSNFVPIIYTGVFSAIIITVALVCDLFLLPAFLYLIDGRNEQKSQGFAKQAIAGS